MGHILFINMLNCIIHYFADFFKCYCMFQCLHVTNPAVHCKYTHIIYNIFLLFCISLAISNEIISRIILKFDTGIEYPLHYRP